ncbi:MAG: FAD-binding oxidoreductase [Gammaproteobacteria bacterium]
MSEQKKTPLSENTGPLWISNLFKGKTDNSGRNKLEIIKQGAVVNEYALDAMAEQVQIGRHPHADIQLEAAKMGMFHAAVIKKPQGYFLQDLGSEAGIRLNEQRLAAQQAVPLCDGFIAELPEFHLRFILPDHPPLPADGEAVKKIAATVFKPVQFPKPKKSPLLANLVENRQALAIWTAGTNTLVVSDIIDETADSKTIRLVGAEPLLFSYKPGQFITLMLTIGGNNVQRSYSMSSSPSRPHTLEITVKRVADGLVSNWLCDELKLGSKLRVKGPSGRFTCFEYPAGKLLFIAAGSGITPIMSMARWITDTAAEVDVKMLVSSKTPQDVIFRKELELMSARHSNFQVAVTLTGNWQGTESWLGLTGRINPKMIELLAPDFKDRHVFICGPEIFMQDVEKTLRSMGFPMAQLHSESFGVGRVVQGVSVKEPADTGRYRIKFKKSAVAAHSNGQQSLLEVAESHGVEIDYSCRVGSCGACMVKCSGSVNIGGSCEMDAKDRNAGYIFACCTRAAGDLEIEA